MQLNDFDFELPEELIAQYPTKQRSASRLLCVEDEISHLSFVDILEKIHPGDLLIFNDTKVFPARIFGRKETGGAIEIMVERILDSHRALVQMRSSKSPKPNSKLILEGDIPVTVLSRQDDLFEIRFDCEQSLLNALEKNGHIPLPPYIERSDEELDKSRYQTVYANHEGAVAAPTAGLHFDEALMQALKDKGVEFGFVTLHVGAGTFQPIRCDDIKEHKMHSEYIDVPESVCQQIKATKARGNKVIAVGTTSIRSIETAALSGEIKPFQGDTDIFIYPGFEFKCIDALITNFHLPKSSLMLLVSAFAGFDTIKNAYKTAINEGYRFFSYGDAMFLNRKK